MTAEEARRLNLEYAATLSFNEEDIDKKIRDAALKGRTSVSLPLSKIEHGYREYVFSGVKEIYEGKGFKVKRNTWSDCRDGDSGDEISISWVVTK